MYSKLNKLKALHFKWSKYNLVICLLAFIFIIPGMAYGYSVISRDTNDALITQNESAGETKAISEIMGEFDSKHSPDQPASERNATAENISAPTPNPIQQETNSTAQAPDPEVYYPATLSVTDVRASGGAVCDGSTYKLGVHSALIFSNGRPGLVQWRIEGLRSGSIETVATGSLQLAENRHSHELPFHGTHYMTHSINTDTGIRFRIISPNDIASQWIFPSEVIQSNPCAQ